MDSINRFGSLLCLIVVFTLTTSNAIADPGTLELGLKTEYTDNARLASSEEVDDFKNTASMAIDKADQFGRLDSYLVGDIEFYTYANSTYSNNLDSNLLWNGTYNIRPETLTWGISDELSEVIIDSREANTPDNRTTRNIFTTGPNYTLNLGQTNHADFTGEYQRVDYKTVGDDSDRFRFLTSLTHLMSEHQQVSANYNWTKTLYGSERELYRNEISGSYRYSYLNYYFDGAYGVTHLKGRSGAATEETDANTWNLSFRADTSRTANIAITYSRELDDSSNLFDPRYNDTIINLNETNVVLLTEWSVLFQKSFSNNAKLDTKLYHNLTEYLISNNDEERNGVKIDYKYPLYDRVTLGFSGEYQRVEFTPSLRTDDRYDVSISSGYEYIRNLFFTAELAHNLQDSNSALHNYTENTVMVGVRYLPTF